MSLNQIKNIKSPTHGLKQEAFHLYNEKLIFKNIYSLFETQGTNREQTFQQRVTGEKKELIRVLCPLLIRSSFTHVYATSSR